MARFRLKKLFRDPMIVDQLKKLGSEFESDIRVSDEEGNLLWETSNAPLRHNAMFASDGRVMGKVFASKGVEVLGSFLSYAVKQAMERHTLAQETLDKYKEINLLYRVTEKITTTLDINKIAQLFVDEAQRLVRSSSASLMLVDKRTNELSIVSAAGVEHHPKTVLCPGRGIAGAVMQSGKTEVINRVADDERFVAKESPIRSMICAPLKSLDDVVGVLNISSADPIQYSSADAKLITALAMIAASSVVNLQVQHNLVQEQLHARIMEQDLEIGRQIQQSFLPDHIPTIENWEVAYRFRSALQVSGDFYDFFPLAQGKYLGIVVADVCSKGVGAALFMGLFRSLIRAYCSFCFPEANEISTEAWENLIAEKLRKVISLTNDYTVNNHGQTDMFATLFLGVIDLQQGRLHYINAGHEMPYLVDSSGNTRKQLAPTGPAVGLMPGMPFESNSILMNEGEMLVAYTDGVTEAMNSDGILFGPERLESVLAEHGESASSLLKMIEQRIDEHAASAKQSDDITMLAVRRLAS